MLTIMKIDKNYYYTPNQIVEMGIMKAKTVNSQRQMLLRYIREGKLPSRNIGQANNPLYLIHGSDLDKFITRYGRKESKDNSVSG